MAEVTDFFVLLLREAWVALIGAMVAFAALALLSQALKTTSASMLGASIYVWEAIAAGVGVMLLVLFGFLGVPSIVRAAQSAIPASAGCGPVIVLGELSASIIGGIAALRMIRAVFTAVVYAAAGGSGGMAHALLESGEAILGMLFASIAIPVSAHFLGAC